MKDSTAKPALWVVRAGRHGEAESYVVDNNIVGIGWSQIGDISQIPDRSSLEDLIAKSYPDKPHTTTRVWTGEVWAFRDRIRDGDLVAVPQKSRAVVAFGQVTGGYRYAGDAPTEVRHQRPVKWLRPDFPRSEIDQDILFTLNGALAVFQVRRNNAVSRIQALLAGRGAERPEAKAETPETDVEQVNIEDFARDQITSAIGRQFRGHDLSRLVADVLRAQGYKTEESPPGADGGVDIVAGRGPMGFDPPRLCVQVKSSDSPIDVAVLRELKGVMQDFGAEQGLIVSWGGFRSSVSKEARRHFFNIRLWDAGDLLNAILECYDDLSDEVQAELPLKRVWSLVQSE